MNTTPELKTISRLSDREIQEIYQMQQRTYWELDFIGRCVSRREEGTGLCNLPYDTLAMEKELLDQAYEIYHKMEDSNVAYNVTMESVIDEIELWIKDNRISFSKPAGKPQVVIVIENGVVSTVRTSDHNIRIDIIDLDRDYADTALCSAVYDAVLKEPGLQNACHSLHVPGYEQAMELEVDE